MFGRLRTFPERQPEHRTWRCPVDAASASSDEQVLRLRKQSRSEYPIDAARCACRSVQLIASSLPPRWYMAALRHLTAQSDVKDGVLRE
jgi:hypothetical protein